MRWRVAAWTHPEDPNGFTQREHSIPLIAFEGNDPIQPRGRCVATVAETYAWQDLIQTQNPADPSDTSLLRLYRDGQDNTTPPDIEYKLVRYQKVITDDGRAVVRLYGVDWQLEALDPAVVRWWDWEAGATRTRQPDWTYGAPSILPPAGADISNAWWRLYVEGATTGDYKITDGTDTTAAIAKVGTTAATIKTRLETAITAITETIVSGQGTAASPFLIQIVDPPAANPALAVTAETGDGTVTLDQTRDGGTRDPWPWHGSVDGNTGVVIGNYEQFDMVEAGVGAVPAAPAGSASTHLLRIDAGTPDVAHDYAGGQIEVDIPWGIQHRNTIDVYPEEATTIRLVLRTMFETLIAYDEQACPADTWTTLSIPAVTVAEGTGTVVLRVGIIDDANPDVVYVDVDNAVLAPGLPKATIGVISEHLRDDAQTDHPTVVRIPWLNKGAYTDTDDSAAVAWPREEAIILRPGAHYGTHVYGGEFADLGYEYDVVPDAAAPDTAAWDLEIWAKDNRGTTHTGIAFHVGYGVAGGLIAGRMPKATRWLAEGVDGVIAEVANAAQETQTGIYEEMFRDPDITDEATLTAKATHFLAEDIANRVALTVELADDAPTPYADFDKGDTAPFSYAGVMDRNNRRITEIGLRAQTGEGGEVVWTPTVTASKLLIGDGAVKEGLYKLLREFDRLDRIPDKAAAADSRPGSGAGGAPSIVVATSDANTQEQSTAHMHMSGTNDQDTIADAAALLPSTGGKIIVVGNDVNVSGPLSLAAGKVLEATGHGVEFNYNLNEAGWSGASAVIECAGSRSQVRNFEFNDVGSGATHDIPALLLSGSKSEAHSIGFRFVNSTVAMEMLGSNSRATSITTDGGQILVSGSNCHLENPDLDGGGTVRITGDEATIDNVMSDSAGGIEINGVLECRVNGFNLVDGSEGISVVDSEEVYADGGLISSGAGYAVHIDNCKNTHVVTTIEDTGGEADSVAYHTVFIDNGSVNCRVEAGITENLTSGGTANHDFVRINDSDDCGFAGKLWIVSAASAAPNYGIHISGTSTGTHIGIVDFGDLSEYVTHPINDQGTDTRWATARLAHFFAAGAFSTGAIPIRWPVSQRAILLDCHPAVDTTPSGGPVTLDVNINGTSAYATATKPVVADGTNVGSKAPADPTLLAVDDLITVDIDAANSAEDLTAIVRYLAA